MSRRRLSVLALGTLAVVGALAIPAGASRGSHIPSPNQGTGTCRSSGDLTWSPLVVWPPNHKLVPITITWTEDDGDSDNNTVSVTGVTPTGVDTKGAGSPKNNPDYSPSTFPNSGTPQPDGTPATVVEYVRAERSGTDKAGRTYTIGVQCSDDGGTSTTTIAVTVPHDMGNHTGAGAKSSTRALASPFSLQLAL